MRSLLATGLSLLVALAPGIRARACECATAASAGEACCCCSDATCACAGCGARDAEGETKVLASCECTRAAPLAPPAADAPLDAAPARRWPAPEADAPRHEPVRPDITTEHDAGPTAFHPLLL